MNTIKYIQLLEPLLTQAQLEQLEAGAKLHLRHSNITFKALAMQSEAKKLNIQAVQGKHLSENYADVKTLVQRTKELFSKYFPGWTIHVHPVPFKPAIVEVVTPEWLADKMLKKGVRITDIVTDTGIDKTNISAWVNGKRPMSQPVKAMFYFYLTR